MIRKSVAALLAVSLLLCACEQTKSGGGSNAATISGGTAASQNGHGNGKAPATLTDALLDNQSTSPIDENDRKQALTAEKKARSAPIGQQITWSNTGNGNSGTITAVKDGYSQIGAYCREFQETSVIGGQQKQGYGTACQQPDGSWKIVPQ